MSLATIHPHLAYAAGPLRVYLEDPDIIEVRVTSSGRVFVVRFGLGKEEVGKCDTGLLGSFLSLVADLVHTTWTQQHPRLHAADPKLGIRIQAGGPPISPAPWMICRKHPDTIFPLDDFEAKHIITAAQRSILEETLVARHTIIIAGSVGSGKTSLLNALLHTLRDSTERVCIIEDDPELRCDAADVQMVHTSEDPLVTMRDLAKDLLRMSSDRIVVGEVRDGAALEMMKAFQCGTPGLGTIHADSALLTLRRFEYLIQEVSLDPQRDLIGEAIDLIVYMERYGRICRLKEMLAVDGYGMNGYQTRLLSRV